jgi:outer membrane protein TolC
VALAAERVRAASAQLEQAKVLWLPTIYLGADYFRHDGHLQDVAGNVFGTSKSTFMLGAGPSAVFAVSDALFAPLAARQTLQARQAALQAAANDSLLAVAEAYFNVQQARGELAGAGDAARRAAELLRRAEKLAPGLVPPVEVARTRTELARRRQLVQSARERWRTASAELARVLRLDPSAVVEPLEPPHLQITLIDPDRAIDDLIPLALLNRPELAARQALVQATLQRLKQEKIRPLIPSVLLRGASTNPAGTLGVGYFGGGRNGSLSNFSGRGDLDLQLVWEFQNLGLGNRARVKERRAENEIAVLELFRTQDRIAAEVVQAHAQVQSAAARVADAAAAVKDAVESANQNLEGLGQTRGAGNQLVLLIRPQEAVASVQALAQAYADYYGAIADHDRAQFRLHRALGQPAQALTCEANVPAPPTDAGPR